MFLYIESGPTLPFYKEGGEYCIGEFFDSDGVIHREPLKAVLKKLLTKMDNDLKSHKDKKD